MRVLNLVRRRNRCAMFVVCAAVSAISFAAEGQVNAPASSQVVASPSRIEINAAAPPKGLDEWREAMEANFKASRAAAASANLVKPEGCYRATYPQTQWEAVSCVTAPVQPYAPKPPKGYVHKGALRSTVRAETVGNGVDYSALVPGAPLSFAQGSFDSVSGVTAENDNGTANLYSLQLNSSPFATPVCTASLGANCLGWQQFLYTPEQTNSTTYDVYIQYWLLGVTSCPSGWINEIQFGGCFKNSSAVAVPNGVSAIANLSNLKLTGSIASGIDTVTLASGTTIYKITANDNVLDLSGGWNYAEFNIFGAGGGTQATLNAGSTLVVRTTVDNGSLTAPACSPSGETGETNNLNLVNPCCPYAGIAASGSSSGMKPAIAFVESNATPFPVVTCSNHPPLTISTVAGGNGGGYSGDGGQARAAQLQYDNEVAVDGAGNVYIADKSNQRVRKVNASTGIITTVAGTGVQGYSGDGGLAVNAQLNYPGSIALDAAGNLYIADEGSYHIRKVAASTGIITTIAGTGNYGFSGNGGLATQANMVPWAIAADAAGNVYVTDETYRITKIAASTGILTTLAGNGTSGDSGDGGLAVNALVSGYGIAVDSSGNVYFSQIGDNVVRKITASTGVISRVAGNGGCCGALGDGGSAVTATLDFPNGMAVDHAGNVYISEGLHYRVRKVAASTGIITTIAGNGTAGSPGAAPVGDGGPATSAVVSPNNVALDSAGNIYISDGESYSVREVAPPIY